MMRVEIQDDVGSSLTKEAAAQHLDSNEYRHEGSAELFKAMKSTGLVAVFGASDDLMEFRGAIEDEIGAYEGTIAFITPTGLLINKCQNDRCPYHAEAERHAATIEAVWNDGPASWRYVTDIPHATFTVNEDGEPYCTGIVFAMTDVPADGGRHG